MENKNELLVPLEEYLTSGVHIGTKYKNKFMEQFIHSERADGLKILDTAKIDERIKVLINFLSKYKPEEFAVVGRRENAQKPIKEFGKIVGCDIFTERFLPGKLTNVALKDFKEYKVLIISDPLTDKNILNEAFEQGVITIGLCDTNNEPNKLDLVVPINNKGKKSLGLLFYLLAKNYLVKRGVISEKEFKYKLSDFYDEVD